MWKNKDLFASAWSQSVKVWFKPQKLSSFSKNELNYCVDALPVWIGNTLELLLLLHHSLQQPTKENVKVQSFEKRAAKYLWLILSVACKINFQ